MPAVMTSRQAAELDIALERNGWTAEMVKDLCKGDALTVHRRLMKKDLIAVDVKKPFRYQPVNLGIFPAFREEFVVKDYFNVNDDASIKFKDITENFNKCFLDKTEQPFNQRMFGYQDLPKDSPKYGDGNGYKDVDILREIGGMEGVMLTLQNMVSLLMKQGNGEEGCLLINNHQNLFYINPCIVNCCWDDEGWIVHCNLFSGNSLPWSEGDRVFFPAYLEAL
ncbi:MAG: hypothetical protein ABFQ53_01610 [Patescibacteria group bacterium]